MAINRMISRDPAEFRAFQTRMTTVGKIRLGIYGDRRPQKIDTFRFTSDNGQLIQAVAQVYGGDAEVWKPQGGGAQQWEVISEARAVPVYVVNGQKLEPWYEAWGAGRTCLRRCDGEWNKQTDEPCLCNGPNRPRDPQKLCKPTIRAQVMLQEVPGLGSWLLESHGENACAEISTFAPLVAQIRMPLPAVLRLRQEKRREWNADKGKFDTKDFYVPWFDVSVVSAQQVAIGGDALTQALAAAGGPALLGGDRMAIEAAPPVSAVPASAAPYDSAGPQVPQRVQDGPATASAPPAAPGWDGEPDRNGGISVMREEYHRILGAIEGAPNLARLDGIREGLASRGIRYKAIQDAWVSRRNALQAAEQLSELAQQDPEGFTEAVDTLPAEDRARLREHLGVTGPSALSEVFADEMAAIDAANPLRQLAEGGLTEAQVQARAQALAGGRAYWAEVGEGELYDEAIRRGATGEAIVEAGGPAHWLAAEDQALATINDRFSADLDAAFSDEPWAGEPVEGAVEDGPGSGLPMVPDGDYPLPAQMQRLMLAAGQRKAGAWTLSQATAAVTAAFELPHIGKATGVQVARVAKAIEDGLL